MKHIIVTLLGWVMEKGRMCMFESTGIA